MRDKKPTSNNGIAEAVSSGSNTRRTVIGGIGAANLLLLGSCGDGASHHGGVKPSGSQGGTPRRGGSLRVSFDQTARNLNPLRQVFITEFLIGELLFNGLTRLGPDMLPEPDLATSWNSNSRLDEWVFNIRSGVTFHDGSRLTADDIVATIKAILDPVTGSPARSSIGPITSVSAIGPLTVHFQLSAPYADLPTALTHPNVKIVRAAHLQGASQLDRSAVGTGPFMLVSFEPAHSLEVKRNPDYFREGKPYVDGAKIFIYPDSTAEMAALRSGGTDLMARVRSTDYAGIAASPGIVGARAQSGQFQKIAMRCDRPPFNDIRVRKALAHCVDRQMLVAILADGLGTTANDTPVSPAYRFYHQTQPKEINTKLARELLANAGYPDGIDLELMMDAHPASKQDFAVALREMAKPAGFRINIRIIPDALYLEQVWLKGSFYVSNVEMRPTIDAVSSLIFTTDAPYNDSHWHDPTFTRLIEGARSELDQEKRARLYAQAQIYMAEQTPSIIPVFFDVLAAHRETLRGFRAHRSGIVFRLEEAWLS